MSIAMEKDPQVRITVDEYHRMAEVGPLAPDARVELIDGVIVDMPPVGVKHAAAVNQLVKLLVDAVGVRATVWCQSPIRLSRFSEPQPDVALLSPRADFYRGQLPGPEDALLAVEVSDTSLRYDLHTKAALYAQHGIPELWVVDVAGNALHVFRHPSGATYSGVFVPAAMDRMGIEALPELTVDLSSIFETQ